MSASDELSLENTLHQQNFHSLVIPVTDKLGKESRKDLTNLLESIEPNQWLDVLAGFDSVEWDFAQDFEAEYGDWLKIIWNQGKALNFTANVNMLLDQAFKNPKCESVLVVNQDCILPDNTILKSLAGLDKYIVSPKAVHDDSYLNVELICGEPLFKWVEKVAFFCPYIPRKIYETIGPLDAAFVKVFSDDDYCLRAQLAGFEVIEADVPVYHKGSFIALDKPGDESGSGCYNTSDLGMGLMQYKFKWNTKEKHENIIKTILKEANIGLQ